MGEDDVRRVAILGGGMGALAAAFELSAPELRRRYRVTVYQMGWRLGGKCASARNQDRGLRSEEHGLHLWFGFYRNAFGLMRRTYEALGRPESHPFHSVEDAFMPRQLASFGSIADAGGPWTVPFPAAPGSPWDDDEPSPMKVVIHLVEWILGAIEGGSAPGAEPSPGANAARRCFRWPRRRSTPRPEPSASVEATPSRLLDRAALHARVRRASETLDRQRDEAAVAALSEPVAELQRIVRDSLAAATACGPKLRNLWVAADLGLAMLSGLLDPVDRVLLEGDFARIDDREFRDWLRAHGAWEANLWAPPVRAVYDATFAYRGGDPRKPAFAAGVAARLILRILFDYRGSVFYLPRAGLGEVVVQPLYELLSERGVHFEFFHRVDLLEADAGLTRIERVNLTRQAKIVGGVPYRPLITVKVPEPNATIETFEAWPATPDWTQLENGEAMKEAGVDFESRWYDQAAFPGEPRVLERGTDFDDVVLGIPLHAAREVLAHFAGHPVLGPALEKITPVPSVSAQVWLDAPARDLGWNDPPGQVGSVPPLDIWTDMTQVTDHEPWPAGAKPRSLQYLCSVAPLEGVWAAPTDRQVPARALAAARGALRTFLVEASWAVWPGLGPRGTPFNWNLLHDQKGRTGEARLQAQYVRANVDPTECCPTSLPGDVGARPTAGGSGVDNLWLASDASRTGLDTCCVESAVMAGRQASRALAGLRYRVPGERFLARAAQDSSNSGGAGGGVGALPAYVDWIGLGQMSIRSPVEFLGCKVWVNALPASRTSLQKLVDQKLNGPSDGAFSFTVPFGAVLLAFLYGAKGFSTGQAIGNCEDREMTFAVLLTYRKDGIASLAFWMPYLTVDTAIAMATGRETWGFPKERGAVETPGGTRLDARSSVLYFTELSNSTTGKFGPIVTLVDVRGNAPATSSATPLTPSGWLAALVDFFESLPASERDAAFEATSLTSLARIPIVNLKQFRDVEDDTRACYQAVDVTSFRLSDVGDLWSLRNAAECVITAAASHDFVGILGLSGAEGTNIPVPLTLGASFDFTVSGGTVL